MYHNTFTVRVAAAVKIITNFQFHFLEKTFDILGRSHYLKTMIDHIGYLTCVYMMKSTYILCRPNKFNRILYPGSGVIK